MFDVGGGELLLIVLAVLLLFGPKKIPELMQALGKGMRQVRKAQAEFQSQINEIKTDIDKTVNIIPNEVKTVKNAVRVDVPVNRQENANEQNNSSSEV
jgi:sec-independent protein translocase protein TatA